MGYASEKAGPGLGRPDGASPGPQQQAACLARGPIPTDMDEDNMTRPGTGYRLYP